MKQENRNGNIYVLKLCVSVTIRENYKRTSLLNLKYK